MSLEKELTRIYWFIDDKSIHISPKDQVRCLLRTDKYVLS